jgi:hypothetical protein
MPVRKIDNKYRRLGFKCVNMVRGKRDEIKKVVVFNGYDSGALMHGIRVQPVLDTSKSVYLNLRNDAALEVVKGVLQNLLGDGEGGAVTMAADEEFRQIIEQVQAAIKTSDDIAEQVVKAVQDRTTRSLFPGGQAIKDKDNPTASC